MKGEKKKKELVEASSCAQVTTSSVPSRIGIRGEETSKWCQLNGPAGEIFARMTKARSRRLRTREEKNRGSLDLERNAGGKRRESERGKAHGKRKT